MLDRLRRAVRNFSPARGVAVIVMIVVFVGLRKWLETAVHDSTDVYITTGGIVIVVVGLFFVRPRLERAVARQWQRLKPPAKLGVEGTRFASAAAVAMGYYATTLENMRILREPGDVRAKLGRFQSIDTKAMREQLSYDTPEGKRVYVITGLVLKTFAPTMAPLLTLYNLHTKNPLGQRRPPAERGLRRADDARRAHRSFR